MFARLMAMIAGCFTLGAGAPWFQLPPVQCSDLPHDARLAGPPGILNPTLRRLPPRLQRCTSRNRRRHGGR